MELCRLTFFLVLKAGKRASAKSARQSSSSLDGKIVFHAAFVRYNLYRGVRRMVVYVEYVFAENCLLDGVLLYLAVKCVHGRISALRLFLSAGLGGGAALLFPLIALLDPFLGIVKFLTGILLAILAVPGRRFTVWIKTSAFFFLFTFSLGGLLAAVYSFFGAKYTNGTFTVSRAPVLLVVLISAAFAIILSKTISAWKSSRLMKQGMYLCMLETKEKEVRWSGFADSGNLLTFRGQGVCVLSAASAYVLFGKEAKPVGRIAIDTVNGKSVAPVYVCEQMKICIRGKFVSAGKSYFTVGEVGMRECRLILSAALLEGLYEYFDETKDLAGKIQNKEKRCSLSQRKRSASVTAYGRRREGDA